MAVEPPRDLQLWIGSVVLGPLVLYGVKRWFDAKLSAEARERAVTTAADAEFKAEVRADLKQLLQGQSDSRTAIELVKKDQAAQSARLDAIEKRQDAQARAHLDAIEKQAREFRDDLDRLRDDFPKRRGRG